MRTHTTRFLWIVLASIAGFFLCTTQPAAAQKTQKAKAKANSRFYFLFLSDVHLGTEIDSVDYGYDANPVLWDTVRNKIEQILSSKTPPAFILYTGDLPEHISATTTTAQRDTNISTMLTDLQQLAVRHRLPLFYMPGNNDGLAGDYCFFTDPQGQTPFSLVNGFSPYPYLPFNIQKQRSPKGAYMISGSHLADGYYSAHIMDHLRIICLNSVVWSSSLCNYCLNGQGCGVQTSIGDSQMNWLKQQLREANKAGDKVYIAMHVPPGNDAWGSRNHPCTPMPMWADMESQYAWKDTFLSAVARYRKTIAGMFYGHTHMDEFRLLYPDSITNKFMQVAISCPGISARSYNNPGFKLVYVDQQSKMPADFATYYVTPNPITWQQPYWFSRQKGVPAASTIHDALQRMSNSQVVNLLDSIYTVKHGYASYDTLGMKVRPGATQCNN